MASWLVRSNGAVRVPALTGDIVFYIWARHFTIIVGTGEFNAGINEAMD